ncbi:MAG: hypothetical protein WD489_02895, partial [Rhodovibrionaceae bacterium]
MRIDLLRQIQAKDLDADRFGKWSQFQRHGFLLNIGRLNGSLRARLIFAPGALAYFDSQAVEGLLQPHHIEEVLALRQLNSNLDLARSARPDL